MGNKFSEPLETQAYTFYKTACQEDEDVQKFDKKMKDRVGDVLAACTPGDSQQLDVLQHVTTSMSELTVDAMEVILKNKDAVRKYKKLFPVVQDFFNNSLASLRFCTAAGISIKSAKDFHSLLQNAIDRTPVDRVPNAQEVSSILGAVDLFCQAENPFGDEFVQKLEAVLKQNMAMLERLTEKKRKLDKRLKRAKIWSKVSCILIGAVVAALFTCSVLAAICCEFVPAELASEAAEIAPLGSMRAWMKSRWGRYEDIRAQREVIEMMGVATSSVLPVLGKIRPLAEDLKEKLTAISADISLIGKHKDDIALRLSIESITTQNASFVKELEAMQQHVDGVGDRIRQARTSVLQFMDELTDEERRRGFL